MTHVALLRGINVGGKNKLPMRDLVVLFDEVGCTKVRTYIQSGNVVFDCSPALAKKVATRVTALIAERLGLHVPLVLRSAAQMAEIASKNPFLGKADLKSLHVGFLADVPDAKRVATLDPDRSPPDRFVVRGGEVYFCLPNGMGRSKLTSAYFDSKLATTMTARNWQTVTKLVEMSSSE